MALDVEGVVRNWINTRTDLVGDGKPLQRGAFLNLQKASGPYVFIIAVGTPPDLTAETPIGRARISATIYAGTKGAASKAAIAYVNVLETLTGKPERMGDYLCRVVDNITGPLPLDDHLTNREEFRYLVDADFWITSG